MRTYYISGTLIDLPRFLETRIEGDTLLVFPWSMECADLRFTVVPVGRCVEPVAGAGEKLIRERAAEAAAELHEGADKVWYHVMEPACEGSGGSRMHCWFVGMQGHALVVSCFVDAALSGEPLSERVLASVEPTIESFRRGTMTPDSVEARVSAGEWGHEGTDSVFASCGQNESSGEGLPVGRQER